MVVNKGHKQINRDILVENRQYKIKNATCFFNWLSAQNVTGKSVLNKSKSFLKKFSPSQTYTHPQKWCGNRKLSYTSCILNLHVNSC